MSTESVRLERRSGQRFQLNLPVTVHVDGAAFPGCTQDVSARGLFVYLETKVNEGQAVELTFTMPSEITLSENMRVRAHGRVLRGAAASGTASGIAVQLNSYQYLPSPKYDSEHDATRIPAREPDSERAAASSR